MKAEVKAEVKAEMSRHTLRRLLAVIALVCAGVTIAGARLSPLRNTTPFRRALTPEITQSRGIAYTFLMNVDGLSGIEVSAANVRARAGGTLRLRLTRVRDAAVVRSGDVNAIDLARADSYFFGFEPVSNSRETVFELTIAAAPGQTPEGVALWVTKGKRLAESRLLVDGVERSADLVFRTVVNRTGMPLVRPGDADARASGQRWRHGVAIGGLAVSAIALAFVLLGAARHE